MPLFRSFRARQWTPTVTQSGALASLTVNQCFYYRAGKWVHFYGEVTINDPTGAVAANDIQVSLPVTARFAGNRNHSVGSGNIYDASLDDAFPAVVRLYSASAIGFQPAATNNAAVTTAFWLGKQDFALALAAGDALSFQGKYEAA